MRGIRRRNARTLAIVVGLALVGIVPLQARASHGSGSTLEQRWELLAEQVAGVTSTKHVRIERGSLPGGTTKLDPAPTATFEVVGRHTGGQGASHYDVELRDQGGTVLAYVPHGSGASAFARRTAPLSWPGTNTRLYEIRILKVNVGLDLAGTFDLRKASILLHQEGTVTKTVARLPLAVKQDTIISPGWAELDEPIRYTHAAPEFDPAPTITLRTTGVEKTQAPVPASFHVRLVNSGGTEVTGSENVHSQLGSKTSSALSLAGGETYRLQVRVDQNIPPEEGRLDSAELVFEQATTETHGITRTVAYHPSVAAAVDLATDGALGFLLAAPEITAPAVDWSLHATVRRVLGEGTARAAIQDQTSPHLPPASVGTTEGSNTTLSSKARLPTTVPGNVLDTEAILDPGTTGRAAQTLLRAAVALRDLFAPEIFFLTPLDRGNVAFASAPVAAKITDYSGIVASTIAFTLHDETAQSAQTFSGAQVTYVAETGWAKTAPVSFAAGHLYRLEVAAEDAWGNLATVAHAPVSEGGGFLAITASAANANAHIDPTPCLVGNGVATCEDVVLRIDESTATLSGARAQGMGQVLHTVSLEDAVVKTTINGQPMQQSAYDPGDPAWNPRTLRAEFSVLDPFTSETTFTTEPAGQNIGTLTIQVPATWSSASLELVAQSAPANDQCADPTTSSPVCVPDLVRFHLPGGTDTSLFDIRGFAGAAAQLDGTIARHPRAASPWWYTEEFLQQVEEADGAPLAIPGNPEQPFAFTGIRPGVAIAAGDGTCTAGWILAGTYEGEPSKALVTAFHCLVGPMVVVYIDVDPAHPAGIAGAALLQPVFPPDPSTWPPGGCQAFCPAEYDFAIMLLSPLVEDDIDGSVSGAAAPCGNYGGSSRNDLLQLGHGPRTADPPPIFEPSTPRTGVASGWQDNTVSWFGLVKEGDSGGPVWLTTGEAVGIATQISGAQLLDGVGVFARGPRIERILQLANAEPNQEWSVLESCSAP